MLNRFIPKKDSTSCLSDKFQFFDSSGIQCCTNIWVLLLLTISYQSIIFPSVDIVVKILKSLRKSRLSKSSPFARKNIFTPVIIYMNPLPPTTVPEYLIIYVASRKRKGQKLYKDDGGRSNNQSLANVGYHFAQPLRLQQTNTTFLHRKRPLSPHKQETFDSIENIAGPSHNPAEKDVILQPKKKKLINFSPNENWIFSDPLSQANSFIKCIKNKSFEYLQSSRRKFFDMVQILIRSKIFSISIFLTAIIF